jgi:reactive chlorine resistance protein C
MRLQFRVAEKKGGAYLALLRWSMVVIFIWFGIQKFTPYAADAIEPLIAHSPFMSWLGVFGVRGEARVVGTIELITAAALIIGSMVPVLSALGAALASGTFALTTSFVFSTPGITMISATGFPIISSLLEQFLIKDIALLAACLTLLLASLAPPSSAS